VLYAFLCLILAFATAATAWLALLAVLGWRPCVRQSPVSAFSAASDRDRTGGCFFAVVIPAHDEESGIARTVQAALAMEYPADEFRVLVVADNCTDGTAQAASGAGATVLVRSDAARRGKGYALRFAFDALLGGAHGCAGCSCVSLPRVDAVVVLDADTVPDAGLLREFAAGLQAGNHVMQAEYGILNPDAAPLTWWLHVGNVMENILFYEGKMRLGLPAVLRGNGMCFSAAVLRAHPWRAFSITEDTEYTLELLRAGVGVRYMPQTQVLAESPVTVEQLRMQRLRWASGNAGISRREALVLMRQGLAERQAALFDAGWSMLTGSRPLMLLTVLLPLAAGVLLHSGFITAWSMCLLAVQAAMVVAGTVSAGLTRRRVLWTLYLPVVVYELVYATVRGLLGINRTVWQRTKRV
jgi:cellulose synthase/poly-beta-1,6-N-acetylglucosamine synthase-like glycosyltransferase